MLISCGPTTRDGKQAMDYHQLLRTIAAAERAATSSDYAKQVLWCLRMARDAYLQDEFNLAGWCIRHASNIPNVERTKG